MLELVRTMRTGLYDHPEVEALILQLAQGLETVRGKKSYSYLPKLLKALADQIVDQMERIPAVAQCYDRWLAEYKADTVRPGTLRGYRTHIERYNKPQLGDKQISLISTQDVQRMYRRLKKEGSVNEHPELGS